MMLKKKKEPAFKKPDYVVLTKEQIEQNTVVQNYYAAWSSTTELKQLYYNRIAGDFTIHAAPPEHDGYLQPNSKDVAYVFDVLPNEPPCEYDEFVTILESRICG